MHGATTRKRVLSRRRVYEGFAGTWEALRVRGSSVRGAAKPARTGAS
jgi:hypothetical protein